MKDETVVNPEVEEAPDVLSDAAQEHDETEQEPVSFSDVLSSMENVEDEGLDSPPQADEEDQPDDEEEETPAPATTESEPPETKLFSPERVNEIVSKRVNETKAKVEAKFASDSAIATATRRLYDGKTDQEIMEALLEEQAKEYGIDERTLKFLSKNGIIKSPELPREPESEEQPQNNQSIEEIRDRIISEAESLSEADPKFKLIDFLEKVQKSGNPKIKALSDRIMDGLPLSDAYDLYKIRQSEAAAAAQKAANASAEPAAPKRRNSGNNIPLSMENATDAQLEELSRRARHGERIVPG